MPRPAYSDEKNETVRQNLLKGAAGLLKVVGPDELSLRRLAKSMEISHTKVYRYFSSKDSLLTAIQISALHDLRSQMGENDPSSASPMARLRAAARSLYAFAVDNPDQYLFLFATTNKTSELSEELLQLRHDVFNDIVAIASEAKKSGHSKQDGRTLANLAWAMLHGLFMLHFQDQLIEGRSFDELFEQALDIMFGPSQKKA
jgi:AcrR family transcriptional regulator